MSAVENSILALQAQLGTFANLASGELASLRRNLEQKPNAGATTYKHTISTLSKELDAAATVLHELERSRGLTRLQEAVESGSDLYTRIADQTRALETQLADYGYDAAYEPQPPDNALDLVEEGGAPAAAQENATRPGSTDEAGPGPSPLGPSNAQPSASHASWQSPLVSTPLGGTPPCAVFSSWFAAPAAGGGRSVLVQVWESMKRTQ